METVLLDNLKGLSDVKNIDVKSLGALADEIRSVIIATVEQNGGHLASALGAVDAITALCYVYDFSKDKIIFDVGHQSYAYKLINEGKERFSSLRQKGGTSGFTGDKNTKNDWFIGGHAGNSLAAAAGMLYARDLKGDNENVVVFVGDASLFNGENLEALFAGETKPKNFLIVFNDNGMSISKNNNGAYKFFSKIALKKAYGRTKKVLHKILGNRFIARSLKRIKSNFKHSVSPASALDKVGIKYYGAFDGHDIEGLCKTLEQIKYREAPVFLHIKTVKGKGYLPAENDCELYHGISKGMQQSTNSFSDVVSDVLIDCVQKNENIVAITAGMKTGTGLSKFAEKYPERFVDAGICEEYAVTFAAGAARNGLKPVVAVYSTFLQRAYDQTLVDVCMQNLPVLFLIDRAGFVGGDGRTHQGLFDLSYLRHIPNLCVLAPKDPDELRQMIFVSLKGNSPVAIRYPNGENYSITSTSVYSAPAKWEILKEGEDLTLLACGPRLNRLALSVAQRFNNKKIAVINARSVKPLDEEILKKCAYKPVITLEENVVAGGFGSAVIEFYNKNAISANVTVMGADDKFVEHASVTEQLCESGFSVEKLTDKIKCILQINS